MNKDKRQKMIIKLINENSIYNQTELLRLMKKSGCPSTQATVSRDIRELRIVKETDRKGFMKYVVNDFVNFAAFDEQAHNVFSKMILGIGIVNNVVIIRCKNAAAQMVCMILDKLNYEGIAGTIAGYNTIFVLMNSETHAVNFKRDIENQL